MKINQKKEHKTYFLYIIKEYNLLTFARARDKILDVKVFVTDGSRKLQGSKNNKCRPSGHCYLYLKGRNALFCFLDEISILKRRKNEKSSNNYGK